MSGKTHSLRREAYCDRHLSRSCAGGCLAGATRRNGGEGYRIMLVDSLDRISHSLREGVQ